MKKHRLFVAINLPDKIKESLHEFQDTWWDFPCKWTKPENIHLTLYFIGGVVDDKIPDIIKTVENSVSSSQSFDLTITDIVYGPTKTKPRMIWVKIEQARPPARQGRELMELQQKISQALQALPFHTRPEDHPFSPHLTLCRFNTFDLKRWAGETLPDITAKINQTFRVESIEIMESKLGSGEPQYSVVKSIRLTYPPE